MRNKDRMTQQLSCFPLDIVYNYIALNFQYMKKALLLAILFTIPAYATPIENAPG